MIKLKQCVYPIRAEALGRVGLLFAFFKKYSDHSRLGILLHLGYQMQRFIETVKGLDLRRQKKITPCFVAECTVEQKRIVCMRIANL